MVESEKSEPELTKIKNNETKKQKEIINWINNWIKWMTFNWIFPFCFPIVCIVIAILLNDGTKISNFNFKSIIEMAYLSGAYIFVGATVLIGLFYEVKAKKIIEFGFLFLALLLLSLFYSDAEQKITSIFNLQNYWILFVCLTTLCFIVSIEKRREYLKNKL